MRFFGKYLYSRSILKTHRWDILTEFQQPICTQMTFWGSLNFEVMKLDYRSRMAFSEKKFSRRFFWEAFSHDCVIKIQKKKFPTCRNRPKSSNLSFFGKISSGSRDRSGFIVPFIITHHGSWFCDFWLKTRKIRKKDMLTMFDMDVSADKKRLFPKKFQNF